MIDSVTILIVSALSALRRRFNEVHIWDRVAKFVW
jgi:hypothetical protein